MLLRFHLTLEDTSLGLSSQEQSNYGSHFDEEVGDKASNRQDVSQQLHDRQGERENQYDIVINSLYCIQVLPPKCLCQERDANASSVYDILPVD